MTTQKILTKHFKNKPFLLREALNKIGITRYELNKLVGLGAVVKLAHGTYIAFKGDISLAQQFKNATVLVGKPSIICLLSALEFYDLTDLISKEIWLMVPANKRSRHKDIRLLRTVHLNFNIAVTKTKDFSITSMERTLIDSLTHPRQISTVVGIESLRRALQLNKTTLTKIVDTAKKLGILHRILPYIEALA